MPDIKCILISVNFERVSSNFQTSKINEIADKLDLSKKIISEFNENRWFDVDKIIERWDLYSESEVKILLDYAFDIFNKNREKIAKYRILEKIYNISPELSRTNTSRILDKTRHAVFINRIIKNAYEDQFKYLIETNKNAIDIKSDRWPLYYVNKETIGKKVIRFNGLPEDIKIDLKMYARNNCFSKYQISKCQLIIVIIRQIVNRYSIKMIRDISEEILLKWLHVCKSENKYLGNSLRQRVYLLKEFYDYMNTTKKYREDKLINQAINITLRNVHKNTKHIDYIPPEVRFAIEEHIDELDDMTRIMYLIFSETGLRFGDQVECRVSDVSLDAADVSMARLHFYDNKNKSKRIKKERYEKRYNNITLELYHNINLYILKTKELRDKYNDDHIFIKENMKGMRCNIHPGTITNHINSLITKYNITTAIGEKWHYINRQMRKSIAVDLISNGASLYNVQTQLYHMSKNTTEIYYAEVDKLKINKLNTEFFKQKFIIMIGEEKLSYFTEEERRVLYMDFLKNHREVELGLCCKHQSEGTCQTLGKNMCASCPKLVTGLKFISKWEKLYNDSVLRINEMIEIYRKHQIQEKTYNEFKEFKKEVNLSTEYKAVIDAIYLLESETNDK